MQLPALRSTPVTVAGSRNRDCGTAIGAQGFRQPQRPVTNGIPSANGNDSPQGSTKPDDPVPTLIANLSLTAVAVMEQPQAATVDAPSTEPRTEGQGAKRRPRRDKRDA